MVTLVSMATPPQSKPAVRMFLISKANSQEEESPGLNWSGRQSLVGPTHGERLLENLHFSAFGRRSSFKENKEDSRSQQTSKKRE
ncbi:hypothetical protein P7K49_007133, partial [Saguinus oedipus]